MKLLSYVDQFRHPLFERRTEVSKKEFFLSPAVVICQDVTDAKRIFGEFIDQFCLLVLTLDGQEYAQIGQKAWAVSKDFILSLPEPSQLPHLKTMMRTIEHNSKIIDEKATVELELYNLRNQFRELNNDFLAVTQKMEQDNRRKLSHKDALIYASQKIGKVGGFEINLITQRTQCTPFLLEMLDVEDFSPLSDEALLSESSRRKFRTAVARLEAGGPSESFEVDFITKSQTKVFQVDIGSLPRSDGRTCIVQGSMKDVSLLKKLETENEQQKAIAMVSSKLASLGEMAGGIAHEINNPMAIIVGLLIKMKHRHEANRLDGAEFGHIFDSIQKNIKRITNIISGLRYFSRDGSKDSMESTSVSKLVEDTLSFCESRLESQGIALDDSGVPDDLQMLCRPVEISQIFLNLINNSFDAVVDLEERWIRIEAGLTSDGFVRITVTDSGKGVDPSIAEKIFNPFFTTKDLGKGTGLGLSISHGIAKRHGGSLNVNAESPNTQFVLLIPHDSASARTKAP